MLVCCRGRAEPTKRPQFASPHPRRLPSPRSSRQQRKFVTCVRSRRLCWRRARRRMRSISISFSYSARRVRVPRIPIASISISSSSTGNAYAHTIGNAWSASVARAASAPRTRTRWCFATDATAAFIRTVWASPRCRAARGCALSASIGATRSSACPKSTTRSARFPASTRLRSLSSPRPSHLHPRPRRHPTPLFHLYSHQLCKHSSSLSSIHRLHWLRGSQLADL